MPGTMSDGATTIQSEGQGSDTLPESGTKMNGSNVNGKSEDSNQSVDSCDMDTDNGQGTKNGISEGKDKLLNNIDGFEIVTRNGSEICEGDSDSESSKPNSRDASENGAVMENGEESRDASSVGDDGMDTESSRDASTVDKTEDTKASEGLLEGEKTATVGDTSLTETADESNEMDASTNSETREENDETASSDIKKDTEKVSKTAEEEKDEEKSEKSDKSEEGVSEEKSKDNKDSVEDDHLDKPASIEEMEAEAKSYESKVQSGEIKRPEPIIKERVKPSPSPSPSPSPTPAASKATPEPSASAKSRPVTRKQTKVDRMLENEKKHGSSTTPGADDLRPFAKLLFELGLDLARENVYKDLVKVQTKKSSHNLLDSAEEGQLTKLNEAYEHLVEKNKPYARKTHKCPHSRCSYNTDTMNALELHKEYEHKGECAMCGFRSENIYAYYFHMEAEHNRQGRVHPVMGVHACPFCPYEHHSSKKNFLKHVQKCESNFKIERNLQPVPADCDIPLKFPAGHSMLKPQPRPPPMPVAKRPEIRPAAQRPAVSLPPPRPATQPVAMPQNILQQAAAPWKDQAAPQLVQVGNQYYLVVQQNGQTFMTPMTGGTTPQNIVAMQQHKPTPVQTIPQIGLAAPAPAVATPSPQGKFEICEICGGFVKDRQSLRIHFFWAHKVEIHPSVMKENPGLMCPNCSQRFWTYQGYKRHMTVSHPNSTERISQMTCYVCTSPVADFITHMTSKHPQVVKHMLSQIRCVVCQDSFPSETALEGHMLNDHKHIVTKYGSLGSGGKSSSGKSPSANGGSKASPVPTGLYQNSTGLKSCSRCSFNYSSPVAYKAHFTKVHMIEFEPCPVCNEDVSPGPAFIQHVTKEHLQRMVIPLERLTEVELEKYNVSLPVDGDSTSSSYTKEIGRTKEISRTSSKRKASEEVIVIDLDATPLKKPNNTPDDAEKEEVSVLDLDKEVAVVDQDDKTEETQQNEDDDKKSNSESVVAVDDDDDVDDVVDESKDKDDEDAKENNEEENEDEKAEDPSEDQVMEVDDDDDDDVANDDDVVNDDDDANDRDDVVNDDDDDDDKENENNDVDQNEDNIDDDDGKEPEYDDNDTKDSEGPESPSAKSKRRKVEEVMMVDGEEVVVEKMEDSF